MSTQAALSVLALAIVGCEKPQLRSEGVKDTEDAEIAVAEESEKPQKSFEELRNAVIGRKFATLTLGSQQFTKAFVQDITDEGIVIAHADGVDDVPWSEVTSEVREKWGYNPASKTFAEKLSNLLPKKKEEPPAKEKTAPPRKPKAKEPEIDRKKLAEEIAAKEKMLKAQLAGIRNLESDLARHSQQLNDVRRQIQAVRASPSNRRKGGIFVERVGGKSTVVDRKREAKELEGKMKAQEDIVAQLTKSLRAARNEYQKLRQELDQLWRK